MKRKLAIIILFVFFAFIILAGFTFKGLKAEYEENLFENMAVECAKDYFERTMKHYDIEWNHIDVKDKDEFNKYLVYVDCYLKEGKDVKKGEYIIIIKVLDVYGRYAYFPNAITEIEHSYDRDKIKAMQLNYWNLELED